MSVASCSCTCFCVVLCVSFCTGHFVMVPLNLTYLHCLQHSLFEHLFNLYYALTTNMQTGKIFANIIKHAFICAITLLCLRLNLMRHVRMHPVNGYLVRNQQRFWSRQFKTGLNRIANRQKSYLCTKKMCANVRKCRLMLCMWKSKFSWNKAYALKLSTV